MLFVCVDCISMTAPHHRRRVGDIMVNLKTILRKKHSNIHTFSASWLAVGMYTFSLIGLINTEHIMAAENTSWNLHDVDNVTDCLCSV